MSCVCWQGFYGRELPEDFGLQHAGEYLASHFGASYKYIWGLGLLAAGQASTMSGTYTGHPAIIDEYDLYVLPRV